MFRFAAPLIFVGCLVALAVLSVADSALAGAPLLKVVVALAIGLAMTVGYPLLVIFSLPVSAATKTTRVASVAGTLAMITSAGVNQMGLDPSSPPATLANLGGAAGWLLVVSVATAAVGNASRHLRRYKPLDAVVTWIGLLTFLFFGVLLIHRRISALVADSQGSQQDQAAAAHSV